MNDWVKNDPSPPRLSGEEKKKTSDFENNHN